MRTCQMLYPRDTATRRSISMDGMWRFQTDGQQEGREQGWADGLPEPDLMIYLDLPAELSAQMLRRRQEATHTQADIHERDEAYLRACRESAREIAQRLGWRRVDCSRDGALRTPEDIHRQLWELVRPLAER